MYVTFPKYIDYTVLKPEATTSDVEKLCADAIKHSCPAVCVNPWFVPLAKKLLDGSSVAVCTVVGFPLGANSTKSKVLETLIAIEDGAHEIDMVINVGAVKSGDWDYVKKEVLEIRRASEGVVLKVIIETCLLTDDEKKKVTQIIMDAGADYVKTSTGFGSAGATVEDIKLMKKITKTKIKIKASGGIRDAEFAKQLIDAGADRLGCSRLL